MIKPSILCRSDIVDEMMVSVKKLIALFVTLFFVIQMTSVSAQMVQPRFSTSDDERKIEQQREQALMQALEAVDPRLAAQENKQVVGISPDKAQIKAEVKRFQSERKTQFKYLTWTHIKHMINEDTVLARMKFLEERDKTLAEVVDRAIQVHVPAKIASERISLAKFRMAKAIRDFFPELRMEGEMKHGPLSGLDYASDSWRMKLKQPIFRGGVIWNTLMLEQTNLEVAKREYDKAVSDLISDVSQAYFEYERALNVKYDRVKLFELAKGQKNISDKKYEAKLTSEIEKLNTDSLYSQGQYDLETANQEIEIARLELQKFLDLSMSDPIEVKTLYDINALDVNEFKKEKEKANLSKPDDFQKSLDTFVDLAYEHRPDLQVQAAKLKATHYAYRVTLGKKLPQADLIVEYGKLGEAYRSEDKKHIKNPEARIGIEVTWPLEGNTFKYTFDNDERAPSVSQFQQSNYTHIISNSFSVGILDDLESFSNLKEAQINSLEQVVELEKAEREALRDVKEAFFNFNKSLIQVESSYKRMDYRERLAQVSKHRLENNEIQISEYLQAEMSFKEERGLVYKALSEFFLSKAKLNKAIGLRDYIPISSL